jgi:hypothetical protein
VNGPDRRHVNRNVEQVDVSAGRVPTLGVVEVQAAILGKEPVGDDRASAVKRRTVTVVACLPADVDIGGLVVRVKRSGLTACHTPNAWSTIATSLATSGVPL